MVNRIELEYRNAQRECVYDSLNNLISWPEISWECAWEYTRYLCTFIYMLSSQTIYVNFD